MAENAGGGNGGADQGQQAAGVVFRVAAQYIKDLSFENPNVLKMMDGPGDSPNLEIGINVTADAVKDDFYESAIELKAHATSKAGTIYDLECVYGGLFEVKNVPQNQLEPFLLINCPAMLFPFVRRLVADLTRESGYPPLALDPVDFGALYLSQKQQQQGGAIANI